jgi:hypothetical protein
MVWSLLPDALRPFMIYCASPSIIAQIVLFLWQTVEIDPLGHVRAQLAIYHCKIYLGTGKGGAVCSFWG